MELKQLCAKLKYSLVFMFSLVLNLIEVSEIVFQWSCFKQYTSLFYACLYTKGIYMTAAVSEQQSLKRLC